MNQPTPNDNTLLETLTPAVQYNCHIADSRHAGDHTLCVYLLKMREFYRWEKGIPLGEEMNSRAIGDWLSEREAYWESLENSDFAPLNINGQEIDPFDADAVNTLINPHGLVYSAGLGNCARPHFFLARLQRTETHAATTIYIAGDEYARDLVAPPAMSREHRIFLRQQSLRRMIWEKVEEWRWKRQDSPMGRALQSYGFEHDAEAALDAMAEQQTETLLLHEIGEVSVGEQLGEQWHDLLLALPRSRVELMVRAVRDLLADSISTLPTLLNQAHAGSIHFYFSGHKGIRQLLAPALEQAYRHWNDTGDLTALHEAAETGRRHWTETAEGILARFNEQRNDPADAIEAFIEKRILTAG